MPVRRRGNKLESWEVALIKAMIGDERWPNDQDILAYFTRPTRSINHRAISEIRTSAKHAAVKAADADELDSFIASWPAVDPETGLALRGDELLLKAREAMIAAVHTFNSAGLTFRAELFIVTAIIAWTYLLHAWFKREGIDYRHTKNEGGQKVVVKTPNGADKFWEVEQCLKHERCPVEQGARDNLRFLLELRHEIEHRSTNRVDEAVSAKLQACCLNFNDTIKQHFGPQYGLERRLPIALQFVTFSPDQRALLKKAGTLPRHIETMMEGFERHLTPEQQADPRYAHRLFMIRKTANRAPSSDLAVELVPPNSRVAQKFDIALKEVEKKKYLPTEVVRKIRAEGWNRFTRSFGRGSKQRSLPRVMVSLLSETRGAGTKHGWIASGRNASRTVRNTVFNQPLKREPQWVKHMT
ncbi:hypothetical protein Rvan_3168 [Rhodomicrobium vannielii ATCC 17100]|uniref:DUF3644 domain-containing protein n=1 Tax=Rhodomicrobium vannielii (strain ATCC 17100 / DSM 162 / LMG 4299 / NCIMB 10020 / ATH 3.1.1) TaxID=648757 RepID=E3I1J0_RHOVT|nr:DUF3644 domain-containing protein [Rhodomicrobium vannielii]ADP72365.1 hypothetical protein Rvan_3168 [Rhodomicrobium vannielii ATCC 17100]